jgi:hypothetical protein
MGSIPIVATFPSGAVVTSTYLNSIRARGDFWAASPRCSVYQGAATSVAYSVGLTDGTEIAFNSEIFDIANNYDGSVAPDAPHHDTGTLSSRVYARTTGKYRMAAQVQFANAAGGNRVAAIRLNAAGSFSGGTFLNQNTQGALNNGSTSCAIPGFVYPLSAGDYIEVFGAQNQTSGTALNTVVGQYNTWLLMELVAS